MVSQAKRPLGLVAATAVAMAATGVAAKDYKLTVASASPAQVVPSHVTKAHFVPDVTKRAAACGDTLTWNEAYGGTLAKIDETLEAVEEGIADVGVILRNFEEAKLPLEQYPSVMPFAVADPKVMQEIDTALRAKIPEMNAMYAKYNQRFLAGASEHSQQLFTTFPVNKYEDLNGRKIGGSGALGNYIRGTGAVLVNSRMHDTYTSISNGLYEGYPIPIYLAFPYRTYQAAKHYTVTDFGTTSVASLTVNAKVWDGFSDCLKKAFTDTAAEWPVHYIAFNTEKMAQQTPLLEKAGVVFNKLSPAERKRWAAVLPPLAKEWAEAVEAKGLPGKLLVKTYMEEARARIKDLPRDWDKE